MNKITSSRYQLKHNEKKEFKALKIRQFSRDLLEFNKLRERTVIISHHPLLRDASEAVLVQHAVSLQEKYPSTRYDFNFITTHLEAAKISKVKKVLNVVKGVVIGTTAVVTISGCIALYQLFFPTSPFAINAFVGAMAGGASALTLAVPIDLMFNSLKSNISRKSVSKWSKLAEIYNISYYLKMQNAPKSEAPKNEGLTLSDVQVMSN